MNSQTNAIKSSSSFTTLFDDSKRSKLALERYMDQYQLSHDDKEATVNFIRAGASRPARFYVPDDAIPHLMSLLNDCYLDKVTNHILEIQDVNEINASALFFQFEFQSEQSKIEFGNVIPSFLRILFTEILSKYISFPQKKEDHYCFCMSSYSSEDDNDYDYETLKFNSIFRIMIPSILLTRDVRFFVYQRVWQSVGLKDLFERKLNYRFRDCFKRSMRAAPVSLLGSCDAGKRNRIVLESVHHIEMTNGKMIDESCQLTNVDSRFKNLVNEVSVNYPYEHGIVEKGIYAPNAACQKKMQNECNDDILFQMAYDDSYSEFVQQQVVDKEIRSISKMLKMLKDRRFETVEEWMKVILSLASKKNRYKSLAVMTTKDRVRHLIKSGEITWEGFLETWDAATNSSSKVNHSTSTLWYWAACDNPSQLQRYVNKSIRDMLVDDIRDALVEGKICHSHIARYIAFKFKNSYVTRNMSKSATQEWYEFVTHSTSDRMPGQLYKWRCIGNYPDQILMYISQEFKDIASIVFNDLKSVCCNVSNEDKDDPKVKYTRELQKNFKMAIKSIYNHGFKKSVVEEATGWFKNDSFITDMDQTPHIIGVGNGVLEFDGPNAKLIKHYHTYPISLYTSTNYVPYDENSEYVKTVYKMLRSLVPDDEVDALEFLLYYLSTSLDWEPKESLFFIIHGGGCHAIDTPIRMFDGTIKMVQDVQVGDKVMGDDNTVRNVKELFRGTDDMYRIVPHKGESFEVNKDHVLSLMFSNSISISKRTDGLYKSNPAYRCTWYELNGTASPTRKSKTFNSKEKATAFIHSDEFQANPKAIKKGDIIDIKLIDLLKWNKWWLNKSNLTLYKSSGVEYPKRQLDIDPYILGIWLGDGTSATTAITTPDVEVLTAMMEKLPAGFELKEQKGGEAVQKSKAKTYRINDVRRQGNALMDDMRAYDLVNNKHIPLDYLTSSTSQRLELLAGILDSDGYYQSSSNQYELTLKSEQLFDDCLDLARSLGFACYKKQVKKTCTNSKNGPVEGTYYRMQIYGEGLEKIPCRVVRKQAAPRTKNKNALMNGFKIEQIEKGDYYGFELDGNHRYLTGDYHVHHNSNGKTAILELFRLTLGGLYARKMPLSFITDQNRTRSSSADPAVMELKNARLVYYSESDRNEKVNVAKVKEITGGETLSGRQLYKEQENFRVNCNHIVTTNHRFVIETTEHAVWRRFISYKFKICFKHEIDPSKPYERKRDPELINKIMKDSRYHSAFLSILVHYRSKLYSQYEGQILKVPHPTIVRETDEYRQSEDIFQRFIMQRVYYYKGIQHSLDELASNFRSYYKIESGDIYKGKTQDLSFIFKNSCIGKYFLESGGIFTLENFYSCAEGETPHAGSILFSTWIREN